MERATNGISPVKQAKEIAQKLGDASLAIRIQRIVEGLMHGRLPTALQAMSVIRSLLYRFPRIEKAYNATKSKLTGRRQ